jgi:hypothetical protein
VRQLLLLAALAIGCSRPTSTLPINAQLAQAEASFDYYDFEVRSLEAQLKTRNERFFIDQGAKELTRSEAEAALSEARLELSAAKVAIDRITREIEDGEAADLTGGE